MLSKPHPTANIEFKLFAPYNEEVALVGTWNNWQPLPMTQDTKGVWHIVVPLSDGGYQYKFRVKSKSYFLLEQQVEVSDPCGYQITLDDKENSILLVRDGKRVITPYTWKHDNIALPNNDSLVIYEMHVGDFSGGPGDESKPTQRKKGRFLDVIAKLDYLSSLGINAIEMMPCQEFPGERSWGYNPRSLFAIENSYGTPDDLCHLIDECHARGMRFIMDAVYNHSDSEAPLTKINYEYWYYKNNPDPDYMQWGPKFDYNHFDERLGIWPARQYVLDSLLFWIDTFHIDGVRLDATAAINNFEFLGQLHAAAFNKLGGIKPFYMIAENIPQNPAIAGPKGPVDAAWHENFGFQIRTTILGIDYEGRQPYNLDALINVLDPRCEGFGGAINVVNYIDNHDQDRILWQLGEHAKTFDAAAFRRNKLGIALLLTAPGVPMIWMGQEFGESAPKTIDYQPIDWALLQNPTNADLMHYYSGLINLRKETSALQGNTFEVILKEADRHLLGFKRWNAKGNLVVVVANLQDKFAGEFTLGNCGLEDGDWHEYIYNYDVHIQNGNLKDSLAESEVKIFIKK
jgi:1,4-alpha-glucan branching enzyme